jgi:TfoX/Sxy family transcriptional regulator of competence genes
MMAFDESLAGGVRDVLAHRRDIEEKKMFGGLGFLLNGNMLVGVWRDSLIARIGPDLYEDALQEPNVTEFDITGRSMKGWIMIQPEGLAEEDQIKRWVEQAIQFVQSLPPK